MKAKTIFNSLIVCVVVCVIVCANAANTVNSARPPEPEDEPCSQECQYPDPKETKACFFFKYPGETRYTT